MSAVALSTMAAANPCFAMQLQLLYVAAGAAALAAADAAAIAAAVGGADAEAAAAAPATVYVAASVAKQTPPAVALATVGYMW